MTEVFEVRLLGLRQELLLVELRFGTHCDHRHTLNARVRTLVNWPNSVRCSGEYTGSFFTSVHRAFGKLARAAARKGAAISSPRPITTPSGGAPPAGRDRLAERGRVNFRDDRIGDVNDGGHSGLASPLEQRAVRHGRGQVSLNPHKLEPPRRDTG